MMALISAIFLFSFAAGIVPLLLFQILDKSVQAFDVRFLLLQLLVNGLDAFGDLFQAPLGIAGAAAREDAQHQDLDVRLLLLQFLDDGLDAAGDLLGACGRRCCWCRS